VSSRGSLVPCTPPPLRSPPFLPTEIPIIIFARQTFHCGLRRSGTSALIAHIGPRQVDPRRPLLGITRRPRPRHACRTDGGHRARARPHDQKAQERPSAVGGLTSGKLSQSAPARRPLDAEGSSAVCVRPRGAGAAAAMQRRARRRATAARRSAEVQDVGRLVARPVSRRPSNVALAPGTCKRAGAVGDGS